MSDTISNMLICLKNASMVGKEVTYIPYSKQNEAILSIFKSRNYIADFASDVKHYTIKVNFSQDVIIKAFKTVRRISKPGRRVYVSSSRIPYTKNRQGVVVISTPEGIMTGAQAKRKGLGGELICEVA